MPRLASLRPGFAPAILCGLLLPALLNGCGDSQSEAPPFSDLCRDFVGICECQAAALNERLGEEDFRALRQELHKARTEMEAGDPAAPEAVELEGPLDLRRAYFDAVLACAEPRQVY